MIDMLEQQKLARPLAMESFEISTSISIAPRSPLLLKLEMNEDKLAQDTLKLKSTIVNITELSSGTCGAS